MGAPELMIIATVVIVFGGGLAVLGWLLRGRGSVQGVGDTIVDVALESGGRIRGVKVAGGKVDLTLHDLPATLSWQGGSTRLDVIVENAGWVSVRPKGKWDQVRRRMKARVVLTGDAAFDDLYAIDTFREPFVERVLTRDVRAALLDLARHEAVVDIMPSRAILTLPECVVFDPVELEQFLLKAATVAGALGAIASGIDILEVTGAPGICPTCWVALEDPVTRCVDCGTEQHRECWDYVGSCARYACASRPR